MDCVWTYLVAAPLTLGISLVKWAGGWFAVVLALAWIIQHAINLIRHSFKKSIRGDLVLITGAGGGLGRQLAIQLAPLGPKLALVDINQKLNEETAEECRRLGAGQVTAYQCDVTDHEAVNQLITKEIPDDFQGSTVDILINNAGILDCSPIDRLTPESLQRSMGVNLLSHFWTIQACWPAMVQKGRGHIVGIASVAGCTGSATGSSYHASKFGLVGLMESLDREARHRSFHGLKFTTICPATFKTNLSTGEGRVPKTSVPWLIDVYEPQFVAAEVINAILAEDRFVSVPRYLRILYIIVKMLPDFLVEWSLELFGYRIDQE